MNVIKLLQKHKKEEGLSFQELSNRIGVCMGTVQRWLSKRSPMGPGRLSLRAIQEYLHLEEKRKQLGWSFDEYSNSEIKRRHRE